MRQIKTLVPAAGWRAFVDETEIPVVGWAVVDNSPEEDEVALMVWLGSGTQFVDRVAGIRVDPPLGEKR